MHSRSSRALPTASRGSALIAVLILSAVALILIGSILKWAINERRLTVRTALLLESRNAAEALAEYGFSQIREKYETRGFANLDPDGSDALVTPPASFWANSNVSTQSGDFELVGGTVQTKATGGAGYYYVDPANPNNANDPLKGKWVWRRDVAVVAKATVRGSTGTPITSYATQSISVRGAPLFAHAIFYNMDLELAPGPKMEIYGPVHANGDLYLASKGDLEFNGPVTASGHFYRDWKYGVQGSNNSEPLSTFGNEVKFNTKSGDLLGIKINNVWMDSRMGGTTVSSDFRSFASQRWNGNLLTAAHGVTDYKPVAIGEYREANPYNPSVAAKDPNKTPSNSARLIIEPSNYPTDTTAADYVTRMEIEAQKYANDAGIYIKVMPATSVDGTNNYSITVSSRNKQDPTKNKSLTLPANNPILTYGRYKATQTYTSTVTTTQRKTTVTVGSKLTSGSNKNKYPVTTKVEDVRTPASTPVTRTIYASGYSDTAGSSTNGSSSTTTVSNNTIYTSSPPSPSTTYGSPSTGEASASSFSSVTLASDNGGIYDNRRNKGVDLVNINMDALRKAVAEMAGPSVTTKLSTGSTVNPSTNDAISNLSASDWTGIVYIEIAGGPTTNTATGATEYGSGALATAANAAAVRIINGKGKVPSYGTANEGLTIATNAPMYVQGDYNADGNVSQDDATHSAHVPESGEVPAALAADAITILSKDFNLATSLTRNPDATTGNIEIAAALLMGLSPTNPTSNRDGTGSLGDSSGGVHNFPRFLEKWGGGRNVFIRGSLVSLFESRVATEPWNTDFYGPPNRLWGFNDLFLDGRYPPGTPRVMSYRRVDFTNLDEAGYQATKQSFNW